MSMRAIERLYLTDTGALVRELDPAGRTVYCEVGDIISDADLLTYRSYFEDFNWIPRYQTVELHINTKNARVKHDDPTGTIEIDLPPRSLIQDIYVRCTEEPVGSPDIDIGEYGGDPDGLIDNLGGDGVADDAGEILEDSDDYKGRGDLITATNNESNKKAKKQKYYPLGMKFVNTCNAPGTAGEWVIAIMYIILPEL